MSCPPLLNAISDPAMILDLENHILEVNEKTVAVTGLSVDELIGKRCHEVFHGQPCPPAECPYKPMLLSNTPQSCPMVLKKPNVTYMVSVSPVYNTSGKTEQVLHIARDITKQLQAEEILKKSEKRYRFMVENVPGVIFQYCVSNTGEAGIHYTSSKLFDIFGLEFIDNPSLLLQTFVQNIHKENRQSWINSVQDAVEKQMPWKWNGRYIKPSGQTIWFEGQSIPTVCEDEIVFDGILIDITEKIEQETERLKLNLQKEQSEKIESLKTMAKAIAHRFNNTMMVIQGNLEFMTRTLPADSNEFKMASDAAQAASGATQVGSMMLSYVGQQPPKLQDLPLEMLVRESVTQWESLLLSPVSLQFTSPDEPLCCPMDLKQIKEVIESILTNASESLGDDTGAVDITFDTDYFTTDSFPIPFQTDNLQDGMYTFCQITDSGHGIDPKDLSRIFEPFFTSRFIGRGLGLALTVGIMRSHNGAIIVDSVLGQGTTVRVLLPSIISTQEASLTSGDDGLPLFSAQAVRYSRKQ